MIIYNYIDMYHTISNTKHNILCRIMNASLEDRLKINCITCYVSKTLKTMQRAHIHTLKLKQFEWLPCTSKWWAEVHLVQIPLIREMIHCNSPCHMLAYTLNRRMILHSFFDLSFLSYYRNYTHHYESLLPETSSPAKRNLPHIQFRLLWVTHERITIEWPIIFLRFPWMKTTNSFY